jgi:hypothetical protein
MPPTSTELAAPKRICIFCQAETTMSREHVFPDWLRSAFPELAGDDIAISLTGETPEGVKSQSDWKGDLLGTTLRRVCPSCNHRWMSRLEERTKLLLLPLVQGRNATLTPADQILLATWATKTVMIGEFVGEATPVFADEDRAVVMDNDRPPAQTQVILAAYEGRGLPLALYRCVYALSRRALPAERLALLATLIVGCCVLQVFWDPGLPEQVFARGPVGGPAHLSLFPPAFGPMDWPPAEVLNATNIRSFVERLGPVGASFPVPSAPQEEGDAR